MSLRRVSAVVEEAGLGRHLRVPADRRTDVRAAALVPFLFNSFSFVNSSFCSVSTTFLPVPWWDQNKTLYRSPFLVLAQTFNLF